jgi:hypothetical protein
MKSLALGSISGCLVWGLLFSSLFIFLCPLAAAIGGVTSTLQADSVASLLEPYLCPENSKAQITTYQTTIQGEFGGESSATGFTMQCVQEDGKVVRPPSPDYAFYWIGILAMGSLVLTTGIAFVLAFTVGGLIAGFLLIKGFG